MTKPIKNLRIFVTTCNRYLWTLQAFAYQFNKYWHPEQQVVAGVFALPPFTLPENFTVHQIQQEEEPRKRRSDGLIKFFNQMPDRYFIWMLEDFWLSDYVDVDGIELLYRYMREHPEVLRTDLTIDRVKQGEPFGTLGHLTVIKSPTMSAYNWSHQGAIWNKRLMLRYMQPGEGSPKMPIERRCSRRLAKDQNPPTVLGTLNWPLKYAHVIIKNFCERHTLLLNTKTPVPAEDIGELRRLGYIDCEKKMPNVKRFNEK